MSKYFVHRYGSARPLRPLHWLSTIDAWFSLATVSFYLPRFWYSAVIWGTFRCILTLSCRALLDLRSDCHRLLACWLAHLLWWASLPPTYKFYVLPFCLIAVSCSLQWPRIRPSASVPCRSLLFGMWFVFRSVLLSARKVCLWHIHPHRPSSPSNLHLPLIRRTLPIVSPTSRRGCRFAAHH